jgi:ATP-dependent RNA helicase RhlE
VSKPAATFEDFGFNKQLLSALEDLEYTEPTPIQHKAIPQIMAGHDILGIAQTGTGKTAAYVLPILLKVRYAQGTYPRALILAPTRELAMQIGENVKELAKHTDIRHTVIYGGTGAKSQVEAIQAGIDILIATPGRLMDIYLKGDLIFKELKTLVLDEADKMMDMGFMPQIRRILEVIPRKRQNLLFSATMPDKVLRLSEEFLEFPVTVEVTPQATAAATIDQTLYETPNFRTKLNFLMHCLLNKEKFNRVIVFTKTKDTANNIVKYLDRKIVDEIRVIHANKDQNARINAMDGFRKGEVRILVATDVAARGLDITNVSHVFNFDVPVIYEDYVHRIGRTGRAQQTGEAITLVNPAEKYHIEKIEKIIRTRIPVQPLPPTIEVPNTPYDEAQELAREIDDQRKKEDPTFQGAFHEKKLRPGMSAKSNTARGTSGKGASAKSGGKASPKGSYGPGSKSKTFGSKSSGGAARKSKKR